MSLSQNSIEHLQQQLAPTREQLVAHTVYQRLHSLADLRQFMQHHVFAVWDFMSLLKALQCDLTCVAVPWVPRGNPATRRLINEIVLEEETDVDQQGQPASHFELYLRSMEECGADTQPIRAFLAALAAGSSVADALTQAEVPTSVRDFVLSTFEVINLGQPHATAAAFTFGREDVIPDMFRHLVSDLNARFPGQLDTFTYYLNRHIELDEEVHTPLAQQMVRELCGDSAERWQTAEQVAIQCMQARVATCSAVCHRSAESPHSSQQMVRELCGDSAERWQTAEQVAIQCMQARVALWDGIEQSLPVAKNVAN